jgi:hypothetical protein
MGGRATTIPRSGPSFLVFLHLLQEARKKQRITGAMALWATKGMEMPPTGVISPKNSLPIFYQSKGCFACFGIKEDVNKMSTNREAPKRTRSFRTGSSSRSGSIPMTTGDCALVSTMCRYASRNVNGANHVPPAIAVVCRAALPTPDSSAPPHSCTDLIMLPPGRIR